MDQLCQPPKTDNLLKDEQLRVQLAEIYSTDKYTCPTDAKNLAEVIKKRDNYINSQLYQDIAFNLARDVEETVKDFVLYKGVSSGSSLRSTVKSIALTSVTRSRRALPIGTQSPMPNYNFSPKQDQISQIPLSSHKES